MDLDHGKAIDQILEIHRTLEKNLGTLDTARVAKLSVPYAVRCHGNATRFQQLGRSHMLPHLACGNAGRGFIIVLALIFSVCFSRDVCSAQTEKAAASKVESLGGKTTKDKEGNVKGVILWVKKDAPYFLGFTDEDVESIDFAAFSRLTQLHIISGPFTPITDRSVVHLRKISTELQTLDLSYGQISDKALIELLKKQRGLFTAVFSHTDISDLALREIATLESLRILGLARTKVSDKGLKELSKLDLLISLDVSRTDVSDAGLAEIKKMKGLIGLSLDGTKVTDAGILELAALPKLHSLNVSSTKVTEDGRKALQKLLPSLEFVK
jgi:hypothetical protein